MKKILLTLIFLLLPVIANAQTVTLKSCMDTQYGANNWTQRTGINSGTDTGPALNNCLQNIRNNWGRGKIIIDPGLWLMRQPPNPDLLSGNYIEGYGSQASGIDFANDGKANYGSVAFWFNGANGFTGGGIRGIGLFLEANLGDTNSYGILLRGNSTYQPDQTEFSDIYMSSLGNSYWWNNMEIDGSARSAPRGVRVVMGSNLQLFNSRNLSLFVNNGVVVVLTNIGCWTSKGATPNYLTIINSVETSLRGTWCSGSAPGGWHD